MSEKKINERCRAIFEQLHPVPPMMYWDQQSQCYFETEDNCDPLCTKHVMIYNNRFRGWISCWNHIMHTDSLGMKRTFTDDGATLWWVDDEEFYFDVERESDGYLSLYFRNKSTDRQTLYGWQSNEQNN